MSVPRCRIPPPVLGKFPVQSLSLRVWDPSFILDRVCRTCKPELLAVLESYGVAPRESSKACAEVMLELQTPWRRRLLAEPTVAPSPVPMIPTAMPTTFPTPSEDEGEGEGFAKFDKVGETVKSHL